MSVPANDRLTRRFAALRAEGRAGLVTFVTAGDPDYDTSLKIVRGLPRAGADVIELGMPFTDPMADGPAIQAAGLRALANGMTLRRTLQFVRDFRASDQDTPIVLMGYFNPISAYGVDAFIPDALAAGADGLIVVDLPPEEDAELCIPALKAGLHCGPCLAINQNERLDYFGTTVNLGARLCSLCTGSDLVLSNAVHRDPEVAAWLADPANALAANEERTTIKGFGDETFNVWRIRLKLGLSSQPF